MKIARPINIKLGVTDSLLVIEGLSYLIDDPERHELDKELAADLKERVVKEVKKQGIELGGE